MWEKIQEERVQPYEDMKVGSVLLFTEELIQISNDNYRSGMESPVPQFPSTATFSPPLPQSPT